MRALAERSPLLLQGCCDRLKVLTGVAPSASLSQSSSLSLSSADVATLDARQESRDLDSLEGVVAWLEGAATEARLKDRDDASMSMSSCARSSMRAL